MSSQRPTIGSMTVLMLLGACSAPQGPPPPEPTPEPVSDDESCASGSPSYELDESGDRSVVPTPQTPVVVRGLEAYDAGGYEEACVLLAGVWEGETVVPLAERQVVQFFLAKALYHLEFYFSACGVIDEIIQDPSHPFGPRAVVLLAVITQHLPSDQLAISLLQQLATSPSLPAARDDELAAYIAFLLGKAAYQQGDFDRARQLFGAVSSERRWYVESRFYMAMTAIRQRSSYAALQAFEDMGHASIRQSPCGVAERRALRDLAALSIGRLLFSGAQTEDAFRAALRAYAGVGAESPHRARATYERAWVHFQLGEDVRALTLLDELPAAFVEVTPEVATLRATIALARCELDQAQELATRFRERWEPVVSMLDIMAETTTATAPPGSLSETMAARELDSRPIRRARESLEMLDAEQQRLQTMTPELRDGAVGRLIVADLTVAREVDSDNLSQQIRMRYARLADEIRELLTEMRRIESAAADMRRGTTPCERW